MALVLGSMTLINNFVTMPEGIPVASDEAGKASRRPSKLQGCRCGVGGHPLVGSLLGKTGFRG